MIVRFLKWALSKFDKKPEENAFNKAVSECWPFPAEVEKPKTKPRVPKATTRKPVAKKIVKNAEKIVKKKAK